MRPAPAFAFALLLFPVVALAQFRDDFEPLRIDPSGRAGWRFRTGEGEATMVDATADRRNVWWALIQREVREGVDLALLAKPGWEVRIEARIRSSHAPRRVNLQIQTQRTTDYHSHLMEFDIPRAGVWETISMTTRDFDARPGDTLIAHMALMDWGKSRYRVDVDYVEVRLVEVATAGLDRGAAVPYHPPLRDPETFAVSLPAAADATIDLDEPAIALGDWSERDESGRVRLLGVDGSRIAILRWDFRAYAGRRAKGSGLLVLTARSVQRKAEALPDFGLLRVVEILGGDPRWDERSGCSTAPRAASR
jgi:hypothetical protein